MTDDGVRDRITTTLVLLSLVAVPGSLLAILFVTIAWGEFSGAGLVNRAALLALPIYTVACVSTVFANNRAGRYKAAIVGLILLSAPTVLALLLLTFVMVTSP